MNKFGLPRDPPAAVKRAVRQRDGFGCVICGKAVYDYEHFDPEYADAQKHDANGIVLLCVEHHGLKTRGLLSKDTIHGYLAKPKCKELGFSFGPFDLGTLSPEIVLGQLSCSNVRCLIRLDGDEILSISPPVRVGLPFRINADLKDGNGVPILKIVDNEWRSDTANWDVDVVGPVITIRNALRSIALVLRSDPPRRLVIERMEMSHKGHKITCKEGSNLIFESSGGSIISAYAVMVSGCDAAVEITGNSVSFGISRRPFPIDLGFMGIDFSDRTRRNDICECGSGLRYKRCHGKL
jgi:hypothetical protein